MAGTGNIRIGISGWRYALWRGVFYPPGLPQRSELAFASRMVGTVEINGSFYALQRPSSYQAWHDATPDDFVFSVKGPKYITHMRRLQDVATPLANFLASGVLALGAKLGPVLWQLPPQLPFNAERLDHFLGLLPRDTAAALQLARRHDERLHGRSHLQTDRKRPLRHALEVRHASYATPACVALLRKHRVALVVADTAGRWPLLEDLTADFVYIRLHGDAALYASGYGSAALDDWARRIAAWSHGRQVHDARLAGDKPAARRAGRDVFCYFDNDVKVHAPYDAGHLAQRLGVATAMDAAGVFTPPPGLPAPRERAPGFGGKRSAVKPAADAAAATGSAQR